jgi:hypothetical protein
MSSSPKENSGHSSYMPIPEGAATKGVMKQSSPPNSYSNAQALQFHFDEPEGAVKRTTPAIPLEESPDFGTLEKWLRSLSDVTNKPKNRSTPVVELPKNITFFSSPSVTTDEEKLSEELLNMLYPNGDDGEIFSMEAPRAH